MRFLRGFILFLFVTFAVAGGYDTSFKSFDKNFNNSSKTQKEAFHKELKQIYVESSINNNTQDKISALERLVHSSKELNYNYVGYENDLKELGGSYARYISTTTSASNSDILDKTKPESLPEPQKVDTIKIKEEVVSTKSKIVENLVQEEPKKEENQEIKSNVNDANIDRSKQLNLMSVDKIEGGISLNFNREVASDEMKFFVLKGDNYRNIIDFKAGNYAQTSQISDHGLDQIRIAQFDKQTSRVVFTDPTHFNIQIERLGRSVIVTAPNFSKTVVESKQKQTEKKEQKQSEKSQPKASPAKQEKPKVVVVDPGHGGNDPGAIGAGLKEKDIVLNIGKDLGSELSKRGYKVLYTRDSDKFINLKSRTAYTNKNNADLFISIHVNAGPATSSGKSLSGVETYFLSPARSERSKNAAALENKGDMEDMNYFSQQTYLNFINREKIIASNKLAIDIQKYILNRVQKKYNIKDGGVR
ncbi:MAG: N-acetylmuramoyl-L-alanine amidase, partial [Campylobacter sp.]|nr:N-acetylmuramoyl-L-alanine amidase [Campylobacter sp.]